MRKHHRGRSPTSRPDCSFTAKLLCCAAHLEKAAWSRRHSEQPNPLRTSSQAPMPLPCQGSFLTSACIGRCLLSAHASATVQKAPRKSYLFPFTAIILNAPSRAQVLRNEKMVRQGRRDTCPEHYSVWIHFWDATAGHWKLDWKGDAVKRKVNDCNVKSATQSNFLKQKSVPGFISQKVVRKNSICLS